MPLAVPSVEALQHAALHHPDPWERRRCIAVLDHEASDLSTSVFLAALRDPVAPVREAALHAVACERCPSEPVCVADVVARVIDVHRDDPDPEVRYKTLGVLRDYALRSAAALDELCRAAEADPDPVLREGARRALLPGPLPSRREVRRRLRRATST